MDKKNKIIISIGLLIIVAATVLIITLVDSMTEDKKQGYSGVYTLSPTTTQQAPQITDSWIDLNLIASDLATTTGTSNESTTMGGVITTQGTIQGYFFDSFGNLVDATGKIIIPANQIGNNQGTNNNQGGNNVTPENNTTLPSIDTTDALDTPVDNGSELSEFEVDERGVIVKYLGDKQDIIIQPQVQGKYVTGIGEGCFEGSDIKSVYIPSTIVAIGNSAFKNCTRLTDVVFVDSSTKVVIGSSAFENCVSLKKINLPAVELGNSAFGNCTALETAVLADGSKSLGSYSFSGCTSLKYIVVPESVMKDNIGTGVLEGSNKNGFYVVSPSGSEAGQYFSEKGYTVTTHE